MHADKWKGRYGKLGVQDSAGEVEDYCFFGFVFGLFAAK